MKKLILSIIFATFLLSAFPNLAKADSIVLSNETITGKITYVLRGLVEIQTSDGIKKITRSDSQGIYKDIVIAGIFKKKKIIGNVYYLDRNSVEISTASGNLQISKFKVKDVILYK